MGQLDMSTAELEKAIDLLCRETSESEESRKQIEDEINEILLSALVDNRNFINIAVNGETYRALLYPGATLSLAGARIAYRFKGRIRESFTRVRTAMGNVSQALGNLPIMVGIDGKNRFPCCSGARRGAYSRDGFCKLFNKDVRLGRGLWCANGGGWRDFDEEESADPTTTVFAECAGISAIVPDERQQVFDLVDKILADPPADPGPTRLIEHKIRTSSDKPVRHKHRHMAHPVREQALKIIEKWKEDGIIEPSDLDYSSAPVMVRKSDETYRMCIDVNARTIKDAYPTPNADTILDGHRGARYISKIDLKQAFLQVPIEESSKKYTAFSVPGSKL